MSHNASQRLNTNPAPASPLSRTPTRALASRHLQHPEEHGAAAQRLANRLRELDDQQQDLETREEDLAYRESALDARDRHLNTQNKRFQARKAELRRREQQFQEQVQRREHDLALREDAVLQREIEVEAREMEWLEGSLDRDELSDQFDELAVAPSSSTAVSSESSFTVDSRPATPPPVESRDNRHYVVSSPTVQGEVYGWSTAGKATAGQPNAFARRTTPLPRPHSPPKKFFTIIRGLRTGVYQARWHQIETWVTKIPAPIFKGHPTKKLALLDYYVGCDLEIVDEYARPTDLPPLENSHLPNLITAIPTRQEIAQFIANTPIPANATWYAVFQGIRTGVFPLW
ncbi:hypothetical protein HWV62_3943 [Athelia sp. TMB]|nr:hypothetical protein HWV62_1749 [Athelia sp. TMB]KAF7970435.1 hypothetical protein HWV62_23911 [Athelia sp. TMB]KAF7985620.1 hypothetical protein HWV62_3943 [Athelia sp. TMB]